MRCVLIFSAFIGGICTGVVAGEPMAVNGFTVPASTSPPFTYCISYLPHPEDRSFLDELENSPPDLFHLGYQIPFKGALGPTYGHELFTNEILEPGQIPNEISRIKAIIQSMRKAGVSEIIPYVYSMAFFGNADDRTGFFRFYDHWNEYHQFGLGPKPATDPALWSQEVGPHPLGNGPDDVYHYNPCVNQPPWREYLDLVVRQLAEVGYDGMFFDVNTQYCLCPQCQEKFDVYLLGKYGRSGLREHFGTDDHRLINLSTIYRDFEKTILSGFPGYLERQDSGRFIDVAAERYSLEEDWRLLRCYMQGSLGELPLRNDLGEQLRRRYGSDRIESVPSNKGNEFAQTVLRWYFLEYLESAELEETLIGNFGSADIRRRCCGTPKDMLLWVETQRFWCDSMAGLFARLKADGRAVYAQQGRDDDFFTVANLGSMATIDGLNKRRVDGIDLVRWAPAADLQMFEEMQQPGSLESGVILSNIFSFRWAMAAGTRGGTLLYKVVDDRAADLAQAEAAAGGGGALIQGHLEAPESRSRWKRFYADHADLWDRGRPWAKVGVLFWNHQVFYEYPEHLEMARRLVNVLSENQVPFELITQEGVYTLDQYEVIFAPSLQFVSDAQVTALLAYAAKGGRLVIVEPFGTSDEYARPRGGDPLADVCSRSGFDPVRHGGGMVMRLAHDEVPQRSSEFWRLMEERANDFLRAREALNAARQQEIASGADMGKGFVEGLEQALGIRMRWCVSTTAPGTYIHAYRLRPTEPEAADRIVVHTVNYAVPIVLKENRASSDDATWSAVTQAGRPQVVRNLEIDVPMPVNIEVLQVRALSPTEPAATVKWSQSADNIRLSVNRLRVYQAIEITFRGH